MTGLASVTFRGRNAEEILTLAAQASLDGVEWGGDVHVPQGDIACAARTKQLTKEAGLRVFSYGSYYRLCENSDPQAAFVPVLETARALGAPMIRIWPGSLSPAQAGKAYHAAAAKEYRLLASLAAPCGIRLGTECHRGSLTETAESTLSLLEQANDNGATTYWQPNPDFSQQENLRYLARVRPFLSYLHVFFWRGGEKRPLREGAGNWAEYLRAAQLNPQKNVLLLEFVKDDSPRQFLEDAAVLRELENDYSSTLKS